MRMTQTFGLRCPMAWSVDIVGDRWSLLDYLPQI